MEIVVNHQLNYDISTQTTATDVARALLAHDRIISRLSIVLDDLFDDVTISDVKSEIQSIRKGSLIEAFLVYIAFHYHGKLAKRVRILGKKNNKSFLEKKDNSKLVSAILMIIFLLGAEAAIKIVKQLDIELPEKEELINTISKEAAVPVERVHRSIKKVSKDNKQIAIDACQLVDFTKNDKNAQLRSKTADLVIKNETLKKIPYSLLVEQIKDERLEKNIVLNIDIHATDIDSATSGWAGIANDLERKRTKLIISPTIDLEGLAKLRFIQAVTDLKYERDKNGNEKLKEIHILNLLNPLNP